MTGHPYIGDETLIAYLDGELDEAGMAAVDAALATDATLVDRLEAHAALADRVRAAYAPVVEEPVPGRLSGLIQPAEVVDLADRRRPSAKPPSGPPAGYVWWGAIAATLVVGVMLFGRELSLWPTAPVGAGMMARGELARALTVQASSERNSEVEIGLTFKDRNGRYCRTFAVETMSGLACREGKTWTVEVAARKPAPTEGEFRQAASATATPVLNRVDELIAGEALDGEQENKARAAGWR